MPANDLYAFMASASDTMSREYERISSRAFADPGTAGNQGEENWAELLRGWLPSYFHVVTKGRILGHDGRTTLHASPANGVQCFPAQRSRIAASNLCARSRRNPSKSPSTKVS